MTKSSKRPRRTFTGRIMKQEGLVSNYTVAQFKPYVHQCNESKVAFSKP